MKAFIKYLDEPPFDLKIMLSKTTPYVNEQNAIDTFNTEKKFMYRGTKAGAFPHDYLYIAFYSKTGCTFNIQFKFKEDEIGIEESPKIKDLKLQ